jgi:hypothetical protein
MLNNILLEEIIKAKLVDMHKTRNNIITESRYTEGMYDLARVDGVMISWKESDGNAWSPPASNGVNILKYQLKAEPFACSFRSELLNPVDKQNFISGKFIGKTDIGYQVLIYSKEIGTFLRFYGNGTMTAAGMGNTQWGWSVKNNQIYITYKSGVKANELNWGEGFLAWSGNRVIFQDIRKPAQMTQSELDVAEKLRVLKYTSEHPYIYGTSSNRAPTYWEGVLDRLQTVFDWTGILIPAVDVVNAGISIARHRYLEAVISLVALIPIVGDTINLIFKGIFKTIGAGGRLVGKAAVAVWKLVLEKLGKNMASHSATRIANQLKYAKTALKAVQKSGAISKAQYDEFVRVIDEQVDALNKALKEVTSGGKLATDKLIGRTNVAKRVGGDIYKAALAGGASTGFAKRILKLCTLGGKKSMEIVVGMFRSSDAAILALFNKLLTRLSKSFATDPSLLACAIAAFENKLISKAISDKIISGMRNMPGGKKYIETMLKRNPQWFNVKHATGFMRNDEIVGINGKYMLDILQSMFASKSGGRQLYESIADDVYAAIAKGETNYFWDIYRTNPFREVMAKISNPVERFAVNYGNKKLDFWPRMYDIISSSTLYSKADIVYNEWVKNKEYKNDIPDLSKISVFAMFAYQFGIYDLMDKSQTALNKNPEYKWITAKIAADMPADRTPYEMPGATDSTTFQRYSPDLDPEVKARYNVSWQTSQSGINAVKKDGKPVWKQ